MNLCRRVAKLSPTKSRRWWPVTAITAIITNPVARQIVSINMFLVLPFLLLLLLLSPWGAVLLFLLSPLTILLLLGRVVPVLNTHFLTPLGAVQK